MEDASDFEQVKKLVEKSISDKKIVDESFIKSLEMIKAYPSESGISRIQKEATKPHETIVNLGTNISTIPKIKDED